MRIPGTIRIRAKRGRRRRRINEMPVEKTHTVVLRETMEVVEVVRRIWSAQSMAGS